MPNTIDAEPREDLTWPPPPNRTSTLSREIAESFTASGVSYQAGVDRVEVTNARIKAVSKVFWAWQAIVLLATVWVQYQSMLWFQNVWGFRGRAVVLEVGLQVVVWLGMAFAYAWFDWTSYNHYCRFRAAFDRSTGRFHEGGRDAGPIDRIISIEVRRRSSLMARWYEVRLLLATTSTPLRIDHRSTQERCLGTFRSQADAHRLASALADFTGIGVCVG
jgi:hypothetical protein